MKKLSVTLAGHHTSISIEPEFMDALRRIATAQNKTVGGIINEIDQTRGTTNLSSAVRVWVLKNNR